MKTMSSGAAASARLLIVEDYGPTRLSFEFGANESGRFAEVCTAESGETALELIQGRILSGSEPVPDIILTDLYMERMNGIELLSKVRSLLGSDFIGALMSVGDDPWERAAAGTWCDAFYSKPTTVAGLGRLLEALAGLKRRALPDLGDAAMLRRSPIERVACRSVVSVWSESQICGI